MKREKSVALTNSELRVRRLDLGGRQLRVVEGR